MKIIMVVPAIGQPVDHSRIAVKGKDHRPVTGEQRVEILVLQPMRVLRLRLQSHEVDHVHNADPNVRNVVSQECHGRESFERGNITCAGHHNIGVVRIVTRPLPNTGPDRAMANGG
jgi:hypothetical protein